MNQRVVSYRNSTSNHNIMKTRTTILRVVSYRNSTSNHNRPTRNWSPPIVVSYRNSTSNHNVETPDMETPSVVSYRNSTSNHNVYGRFVSRLLLYLIEILHQTTTGRPGRTSTEPLYLIEILHQTTTKVFFIYLWCKNSTSYHNKAICRRFSTYCLRVLRGDFFYIS